MRKAAWLPMGSCSTRWRASSRPGQVLPDAFGLQSGLALPYDVAGISSFSLRIVAGVEDAAVQIESFVRGQTLIAALAIEAGSGHGRDIEWSVLQADGRPLPGWLRFLDRSTLSGVRPVDVESIDLRVIGVLPDGTTVTNEIRLNARSGEIQPLQIGRSGLIAPWPFADQLRAEAAIEADGLAGLARFLEAAE